jgi:type IV pilus assembly protein PilZ
MGRNRRKHPRVRARDLAAQVVTATGRIPAQVENISRGGAFVRTDRPLEVGTELTLQLARPGLRRVLSIAARVTTCIDAAAGRLAKRVPGMGVMFVSLDASQAERLVALLKDLGTPDAETTVADDAAEPELQALGLANVKPTLADDIEGALRDAELPAPAPLDLTTPDSEKLMVQLRGLVMQLSDAQQQLSSRDLEIERLREELEAAREMAQSLQRARRNG